MHMQINDMNIKEKDISPTHANCFLALEPTIRY